MVIVRKHELGKYKIITVDGMFFSPNDKGEGMYLGRGYYKPERQRGVGHQFRKQGDVIIDTLMGIGSPILKHKDLNWFNCFCCGKCSGCYKEYKRCPKGIP